MTHARSSPRIVAAALAVAALVAACDRNEAQRASPAPDAAPRVRAMARALGRDVVRRLVRGYVPGRSGEIQVVPRPWNVLAQWNGGLRGADDPRTTHPTPWDYHQRVPLALYGPGFVRDGVISTRSVDLADIAPTIARLLRMPFDAANGSPLREALRPSPEGSPRVVVVVVYDGGGWNLLERWPNAWPTERRLAMQGTAFVNATTGSAPSITAPAHATIGTGSYPRTHGIPENTIRLPDGTIGDVYGGEAGDPSLLAAETVADTWERRHHGEPWVGIDAYETWHLGMMGAGTPGADRDVALLWDRHAGHLWAPDLGYRLPRVVPSTALLERDVRALDVLDGVEDRRWSGGDLSNTYELPGTPAFATFAGQIAAGLVRHEPMGDDRLTDLLFVELKATDYGGHVWGMLSSEERAVLAAQDAALRRLVRTLDEEVGRRRYALMLTADHGQTPNPAESGGLRIDRYALRDDLRARFGEAAIQEVHPGQVFLDEGALHDAGATVGDVAGFIADYRYGDGLPSGTDASTIPADVLDDRVFAAALPGRFLERLTLHDIRSLGPGRYPEGDLSSSPAEPARLLAG